MHAGGNADASVDMHDQPQHPIPARAGYVVGYRLLQELARTYSVAQMARWPIDRVYQEVRDALARERVT